MLLMLNGCVSINSFQEGRTLGKDKVDIGISANYGDLANYSNQDTSLFPHVEFLCQIGVANKIDLGLKVNSSSMIGGIFKIQILGDTDSKFATSIGNESGIGPFRLLLGGINYYTSFSIYNSFHAKDNIAILFTPKYIVSNDRLFDWPGKEEDDPIEIDIKETFGISYGLIIGKKNRFGLEFSHLGKDFYRPSQIGINYTLRLNRNKK